MHEGYYQNILYPLQDKVLMLMADLTVGFYLTGGTALSRAYLNHRYSDDLDFFLNDATDFKEQLSSIFNALKASKIEYSVSSIDEGFARLFVADSGHHLKLDFVNDVAWRAGDPQPTDLFPRTDNIRNILSNKLTALGRYSSKDVVDIIYICGHSTFNWKNIFEEAGKKDVWVNAVSVAGMLESYPIEKLDEINWIGSAPKKGLIARKLECIIGDIMLGRDNSLFPEDSRDV